MTTDDMLTLLRHRKQAQELLFLAWLDRKGDWVSEWAEATVSDDRQSVIVNVIQPGKVPSSEASAHLVTFTDDIVEAVTVAGSITAISAQTGVFRITGTTTSDVHTYRQAYYAVDVSFYKPETYELDSPEAVKAFRDWLGCTQVYFPEDEAYDAPSGLYQLKFWDLADEIRGGPYGCAAFPHLLTIPSVEKAVIKHEPEECGYYFGPDLTYNERRRCLSFGQYSIRSLLRGPDSSVDLFVSELAGTVVRTGIPTRQWYPKSLVTKPNEPR